MRLARESAPANAPDGEADLEMDRYMDDQGEDKTFAAMGVAKTIGTVSGIPWPGDSAHKHFCRS